MADPARRRRLKAKWEAGECVREHIAVSCCLLLLASQGMLKESKKFTRDKFMDWAFGKDTVYAVWIVFHAVCSCAPHLHLTWRARVWGIVVQCDVTYGIAERSRIESTTQKTASGCADVFRTVTSGTALHLELQIKGPVFCMSHSEEGIRVPKP